MWLKQLVNNEQQGAPQKIEEQVSNEGKDNKTESILKSYTQNLVLSEDEFESLLIKLANCKSFVFDLETNSLDYMEAEIVGFVFLLGKESYYIPVAHDYLDAPDQLSRHKVLDSLKPYLRTKV